MKRHKPTEAMDWERPSDRYLAYLDRVAEACITRDPEALDKLLRMRMSSHVPRGVLDELEFFRRSRGASMRAPLKLMRYVHQMKQLATTRGEGERPQLPLELREREVASPIERAGKREQGMGKGATTGGMEKGKDKGN